ncbi:MAG TPA: 50S ribosomal protein L13 [Candidatus Azoamicus sp. OHIO1]
MKKIEKKETATWIILDAENEILGRLACKISTILRGKNKITYAPNKDTGDYVIVINAKKIKTTGNKLKNKTYYRHSGYPGHLKSVTLETMLNKHPGFVLKNAVKGMLPKNKLSDIFLKKLKIYPDNIHPHSAQKPKILEN